MSTAQMQHMIVRYCLAFLRNYAKVGIISCLLAALFLGSIECSAEKLKAEEATGSQRDGSSVPAGSRRSQGGLSDGSHSDVNRGSDSNISKSSSSNATDRSNSDATNSSSSDATNSSSSDTTNRSDSKIRKDSNLDAREVSDSGSSNTAGGFVYPKCTALMHEYFVQRYILAIGSPLFLAIFMLLLLQFKVIGGIQDRLRKSVSAYALQILAMTTILYVAIFLIKLPISIYSSYFLEHQFALSHQSLSSWFSDELRRFLVDALAIPLVTAGMLCVRKFQDTWYLSVWLILSATIAIMVFIEPLAIDPLFNKFTALPDCSLKTSIIELCHKAGLADPLVSVADKSKQTEKLNAYVTGFSSSKRIVLYDKLIKEVPEDEILAVVSHELGHYQLNHIILGLTLIIAGLLPLIFMAEKAAAKIIPSLPARWGIQSVSAPASIALWCIVIWIAPLLTSPIESFVSRKMESAADAYGIKLTGNPLAAARLFSRLSKTNLSDPDPPAFIEFWFFSHPSIKHRIDYALCQVKQGES